MASISSTAQNFWTCSTCGAQVPNGCTHHCPNTFVTVNRGPRTWETSEMGSLPDSKVGRYEGRVPFLGHPPIMVVSWIDSSLQNSQVDSDDFPKPVVITSVGFVVDETDEYVTLARDDMGHDGDYRGLVAIPRVAVLQVEAA